MPHNIHPNQVEFNFFPLYNDAVQAELFKLQQVLANFLIDQLENKEISIKRAAEIAKQALSIIPDEENPNIKLDEIEQQLITIPELSKLDFKLILK